jgi:UDP-N-acetylglucosamine 2-epimerase (non-hydrolysing)
MIALILGTRPQIIKSAPIIYEAERKGLDIKLIHTGQHYDYNLSKIFFSELNLPDPYINLDVGSGSHAYQTAEIMLRLENVLMDLKPCLVVVPGDTNSALAGALTAVKLGIKVAHVEAGARSYDTSMPEEINRRLVDHISSILFTVSERCSKNLEKEAVLGKIFLAGDTMYDVFLKYMPIASKSNVLKENDLEPKTYAVLTLHRAENVDNPLRLENIIKAIIQLNNVNIVFPVHPRTKSRLSSQGLIRKLEETKHVRLLEPLGYHEMLKLMSEAKLVMTDSGGIQKEAFWLKVPCVTLRENTEWVETVELGANFLVGYNTNHIISTAKALIDNNYVDRIKELPNPYGDGRAAEKMIKFLSEYLNQNPRA